MDSKTFREIRDIAKILERSAIFAVSAHKRLEHFSFTQYREGHKNALYNVHQSVLCFLVHCKRRVARLRRADPVYINDLTWRIEIAGEILSGLVLKFERRERVVRPQIITRLERLLNDEDLTFIQCVPPPTPRGRKRPGAVTHERLLNLARLVTLLATWTGDLLHRAGEDEEDGHISLGAFNTNFFAAIEVAKRRLAAWTVSAVAYGGLPREEAHPLQATLNAANEQNELFQVFSHVDEIPRLYRFLYTSEPGVIAVVENSGRAHLIKREVLPCTDTLQYPLYLYSPYEAPDGREIRVRRRS